MQKIRLRIPKRLLSGALAAALAVTPALAFTDTGGHWAASAIDKWSQSYGVLQGYEDGSFRPDASITRGAFAGILDRFLQFQSISAPETFSDTAGTYWESSILKLNAAGVYLGSEGKALPGNTITRQQGAAMVARAFHIDAETTTLPYSDADSIAEYARPYIAEMTARGWFSEVKNGAFRPADPLTRAELVSLLNHMIDVLVQESGPHTGDTAGSLLISASGGAALENMTIAGDLILAPGVTGEVTLNNVIVQGAIRNFSSVTPRVIDSSDPGETAGPASSDGEFDWGIVVVPMTPAENTNQPAGPGIQPGEVYTPGVTTGGTIAYDGRQIPIYADREASCFGEGDFVWEGDRLVYQGGDFRTRFGVDVSAYQNRASENQTIDWQAAANDGVEFAMVRVGLRGYSTGALSEDAFYRQNIRGAMDAGIETGVYFFAQAITVEEAIEEADFVIERLRDLDIDGPVAYDWEMSDSRYRVYGTAPEMATACAVAFCQRIAEAGYRPMVYAGTYVSYIKYDQGALAPYLSWYPEYKSQESEKLYPTLYYHMDYWQYSSKGSVAGIGGNVDVNLQFLRRA